MTPAQTDPASGPQLEAARFWEPLAAVPDPGAETVLVCQIAVPDWSPCLPELTAVLSADEQRRADRFVFDAHVQRYTIVHGALRWLLGSVNGVAAEELQFEQPRGGKPYLVGCDGRPSSLRYNLSVSSGVALVAVARGRELGVDVECVRPLSHQELARRFFAAEEVEALERMTDAQQQEAFFACWTRKEAYVKALGTGLAMELDAFAVSVRPGGPVSITRQSPADSTCWSMHDLGAGHGFHAALAVEGTAEEIVRGTLVPDHFRD